MADLMFLHIFASTGYFHTAVNEVINTIFLLFNGFIGRESVDSL